jgi:hypothetical protein
MRPFHTIRFYRGRRILADMMAGRHDLAALAAKHRVTRQALVDWMAQPAQQRTLANQRRLEDYQAQLYLSRCRSMAVARLVDMTAPPASEEGADAKPDAKAADVRRRACVDLLKAELLRATAAPRPDDDDEPADPPTPQQLYGDEAGTDERHEPPVA